MSEQNLQRRSFTDECKRETTGMVIDTGRSIAKVAKEIAAGEQALGAGNKGEKGCQGFAGEPTGVPDEDERAKLNRLRKEVF